VFFILQILVGLGVTLFALTRDQDADLARLALFCRAGEGMIGALSAVQLLGLVSLAKVTAGTEGVEVAAANALGRFVLRQGGAQIAALCFAFGSTLFSYLFLRARSIPAALAWMGLIASVLLVMALPVQIASGIGGGVALLVWVPMAAFEVSLAVWLIVKGVTPANGATP
jgi:hypothetical protein